MPPLISETFMCTQPANLDGAAEGDLAIALAEVQVAHAQAGAIHIDGEEHLGAARQILDVAVAAVLARRHGARAFGGGLVAGLAAHLAHVGRAGRRRVGQAGHAVGVGGDEGALALVPHLQHGPVRQAADEAGMDEAGEVTPGIWRELVNMPLKSQIDFWAEGKWVGQEAAAIVLEKKPLKPQRLSGLAPMSSRSTTSRSPGWAPFTPTGPDR